MFITKKDVWEFAVVEIVYLRLQLLKNLNLAKIRYFSDEEQTKLFQKILKQSSQHWQMLVQFLLKPKDEIEKIENQLKELRKNFDEKKAKEIEQLPAVDFQILLKFCDLSDEEIEKIESTYSALVASLLDALDLEKLKRYMQKNYYGTVEVSDSLIVEALLNTCAKLAKPSSNFRYFLSWLKAETSADAKLLTKPLKTTKKLSSTNIIELDSQQFDTSERTLHEIIGSVDSRYELIEEAERICVLVDVFEKFIKENRSEFLISEDEISEIENLRKEFFESFEKSNFEEIISRYESSFFPLAKKIFLSISDEIENISDSLNDHERNSRIQRKKSLESLKNNELIQKFRSKINGL